ncbi:hypothetical protein HEK616_42620 [Streptomyces nigrescens]|uniref:Uncharacterized protein n=2 Tax=Streptomyces TaxID=1883 RepID=A0ABM7ZWR9_STRNI|nr:hypothetical protein [Streptomyces nigrescens]MEE4422180.1 hypothetical protein [Streptomyces sp. DSM 41528]BDM70775.1 hypothetical protein HEK616_42620 [Streptomyces nigrescens]
MPKDDSFVDAEALVRLTKTFEAYGSSPQGHTEEPPGDADSAAARHGSRKPINSDELRHAYVEMANLMADSLGALVRQAGRLDDALRPGERAIDNSAVPDADQGHRPAY